LKIRQVVLYIERISDALLEQRKPDKTQLQYDAISKAPVFAISAAIIIEKISHYWLAAQEILHCLQRELSS